MSAMLTLQKIKDKDPCNSWWATILAKHGKNPDYNKEFPLIDILNGDSGRRHTLWALRCVDIIYGYRMAIACAKHIKSFIDDAKLYSALILAEQHINGTITKDALQSYGKRNNIHDIFRAASQAMYESHCKLEAQRKKSRPWLEAVQNEFDYLQITNNVLTARSCAYNCAILIYNAASDEFHHWRTLDKLVGSIQYAKSTSVYADGGNNKVTFSTPKEKYDDYQTDIMRQVLVW